MSDRLSCRVPFCRRTAKQERLPSADEWLCAVHWPLVSKTIKRRRAKIRRMLSKTFDPDRIGRLHYADHLLWSQAKKQAIERAVGI